MEKLPKIQDLYIDKSEAYKNDALQTLLNSKPKESWVKEHPFIKGYKYLPIDKVEFLLQKIFKKYKIEILREGISFNGVYVVVRVHYQNPVSGEMAYHDGIGATQLQTKSGKSASDLININNGALSMAYPMAKTLAIKDACDHFGNLFGANLNRKDTLNYSIDETLKVKEIDLSKVENLDDLEILYNSFSDLEKMEYLSQFQNKKKELSHAK